MTALTNFRTAVKAALAAPGTGLGVNDVIDGYLQGPLDKKSVACVFPVRLQPQAGNQLVEQKMIGVRVLSKLPQGGRVMPEQGLDPAPLEALAEQLELIVKANQTTVGPWYMQLVSIDFDISSWAIEAALLGWSSNPAV